MVSRNIKQSEAKHGDAILGDGTYFTHDLGPSNSRHAVAKNNFDGDTTYWESKLQGGKTDIVFEMKLPKDKVQDHSSELKRDVHLHPGSINLNKVKDLKMHIRTGDKAYKTLGPI